jgi:hypothetical protein
MDIHKFVKKYSLSPAWIASLCGFKRTQVSNWFSQPEKYPMPAKNRLVIAEQLKKMASEIKALDFVDESYERGGFVDGVIMLGEKGKEIKDEGRFFPRYKNPPPPKKPNPFKPKEILPWGEE